MPRAELNPYRPRKRTPTDTERGRTTEFKRNRALVAATYGTRCHWCGIQTIPAKPTALGQPRHPRELTADHLVPLSRGGSSQLVNLRPACLRCNTSRGNRARPRHDGRVRQPTWTTLGTSRRW